MNTTLTRDIETNETYECLLWGEHTRASDYGIEGSCLTCSPSVLPARVVHVDRACESAWIAVRDRVEVIDISRVPEAVSGSLVLVQGSVATRSLDTSIKSSSIALDEAAFEPMMLVHDGMVIQSVDDLLASIP